MKLSDLVPLGDGAFEIEGRNSHPNVFDMIILLFAGTLTDLTPKAFQEDADVFLPSSLEETRLSTVFVDCIDGQFVNDKGKKERLAPEISKVLPRIVVGQMIMILANLEDNEQKIIEMDNSGQERGGETRKLGKIYVVKLIRILTQPEAELVRVIQGLEPKQRSWDTTAAMWTIRVEGSYRVTEVRELWNKIWDHFKNAGPKPLSNIDEPVDPDKKIRKGMSRERLVQSVSVSMDSHVVKDHAENDNDGDNTKGVEFSLR